MSSGSSVNFWDEALARSREIIDVSKALTQRNTLKKLELDEKFKEVMSPQSNSYRDKCFELESHLKELSRSLQLSNEKIYEYKQNLNYYFQKSTELQEQVSDLQSQNQKLVDINYQLDEQTKKFKERNNELTEQNQKLMNFNSELQSNYQTLENQLSSLQSHFDKLEYINAQLESKVQNLYSEQAKETQNYQEKVKELEFQLFEHKEKEYKNSELELKVLQLEDKLASQEEFISAVRLHQSLNPKLEEIETKVNQNNKDWAEIHQKLVEAEELLSPRKPKLSKRRKLKRH